MTCNHSAQDWTYIPSLKKYYCEECETVLNGTEFDQLFEAVIRGATPPEILADWLEARGDHRYKDIRGTRSQRSLRRRMQKKVKHRQRGKCPDCGARTYRKLEYVITSKPNGYLSKITVISEKCTSTFVPVILNPACGLVIYWGVAELADAYRLGVTGRKVYLPIGPLWRKGPG